MKKFVGIKSKMYAFTVGKAVKKKAKGVSSCVVKKSIRFNDYEQCVMNGTAKDADICSLRSYDHHMYTIQQTKLGLSPIDTKRYINDDGISTLAYGHYKISKSE